MRDLYLRLVLSKLSTNTEHCALTQEAQNTINSFPVSLLVSWSSLGKLCGIEVNWNSTAHIHNIKFPYPSKPDGFIQTAYWKWSITILTSDPCPRPMFGRLMTSMGQDQQPLAVVQHRHLSCSVWEHTLELFGLLL